LLDTASFFANENELDEEQPMNDFNRYLPTVSVKDTLETSSGIDKLDRAMGATRL
jgi:hypothetical protein